MKAKSKRQQQKILQFAYCERAIPSGAPSPGLAAAIERRQSSFTAFDADQNDKVPKHVIDAETATLETAARAPWLSDGDYIAKFGYVLANDRRAYGRGWSFPDALALLTAVAEPTRHRYDVGRFALSLRASPFDFWVLRCGTEATPVAKNELGTPIYIRLVVSRIDRSTNCILMMSASSAGARQTRRV